MPKRPRIHELIHSRKAPKPLGASVQAIHVQKPGSMLFISSQMPIEMPSGRIFRGDIRRQAELVFWHIKNIVQDAKFNLEELVKITIYLRDLKNINNIDSEYYKIFVGRGLPARTIIGVSSLPEDVSIQVDAVAIKSNNDSEEVFTEEDFA